MNEIKINLNDTVKVKLNDFGIELLKEKHRYYDSLIPNHKPFELPKRDADGYTEYQLYELFENFGSSIRFACVVPFDTDIIIQVK